MDDTNWHTTKLRTLICTCIILHIVVNYWFLTTFIYVAFAYNGKSIIEVRFFTNGGDFAIKRSLCPSVCSRYHFRSTTLKPLKISKISLCSLIDSANFKWMGSWCLLIISTFCDNYWQFFRSVSHKPLYIHVRNLIDALSRWWTGALWIFQCSASIIDIIIALLLNLFKLSLLEHIS